MSEQTTMLADPEVEWEDADRKAPTWLDRVMRVVHILASIGIFLIMITVLANVAGRFFFSTPVPFSSEMVGFFELPVVALLGMVIAKHLNEHLQAPLIFDSLTWGNRRILVVIATGLVTLTLLVFVYFGFIEAMHGFEIKRVAGVSPLQSWPVLFLLPITFLTLAAYYAAECYQAIRGKFDAKSDLDLAAEEYKVSLDDGVAADVQPIATRGVPTASKAAKVAARNARRARKEKARQSRRPTWVVVLLIALLVGSATMIFALPSRELVGGATIVVMIVLLFFRVPIAFTLIIPSILAMYSLRGERAVENLIVDGPESSLFQYLYSALPMFILLGMILAASGIADRIYDACRMWFGRVPGGLAVATSLAGGGMSAISGSTIGTAYTLGRIAVPQLLRDGFDRRLAVGSVIAASLPGQIVPPSLALIIMSGITGAAAGPQLLAGIVPGISMMIIMMLLIVSIAIFVPRMAGRSPEQLAAKAANRVGQPDITWGDKFRSLSGVWPVGVMFIALFGALYGGVLTATEAGAAGAFVASLLLLWFRRNDGPFGHLLDGARKAVSSVGAIFLVLIGAMMLTRVIAVSGLGQLFSDFILDLGFNRIGFLLVVMLVYFLLGTFMEPLPMWLLTIPLLQPVFEPLGIDLLWFGVFAVIMGEIAILSPPIGILTFLVHGLVQDKKVNLGQRISLNDVYNATWMLMPGYLVLLMVMIFFPEFVTFLATANE